MSRSSRNRVNVAQVVKSIDRRKLRNNTQRALLSLLNAEGEWVARTSIRVPSVSARLRDLRKPEFGGFDVECVSASELNPGSVSRRNRYQTFYRLNPRSVTVERLERIFEGVVTTVR